MSFGKNLQFLRRMHNGMTQEELAEQLHVSRQTVSKWESDAAYPEMEKVFELCGFFSCSMDRLLRDDLNVGRDAYSPVGIRRIEGFRYAQYAVISHQPEDDALAHMEKWATAQGVAPDLIGWDFPHVSQEQINVFHMHGYAAACILPEQFTGDGAGARLAAQPAARYAVITIENPFLAPFDLIPNAYKTVLSYLEVNGIRHRADGKVLDCFERVYRKGETEYMDVLIAVED